MLRRDVPRLRGDCQARITDAHATLARADASTWSRQAATSAIERCAAADKALPDSLAPRFLVVEEPPEVAWTVFERGGWDVVFQVIAQVATACVPGKGDTSRLFEAALKAAGLNAFLYDGQISLHSWRYSFTFHVECKPGMDEDLPAVLRQVRSCQLDPFVNYSQMARAVVVQRYTGTAVAFDRVALMFGDHYLVLESDLDAAGGAVMAGGQL